jgi:hypothetical protein
MEEQQDRDAGSAMEVVARAIVLVRQLDAVRIGLGGRPMTAERMRAQNPALFAGIDAFAPGLLDLFMSAIGGDADALAKLGEDHLVPEDGTALCDPMTVFADLRVALEDQRAAAFRR